MKKRGISPLIATVLLIGFTIVLGVFVMQWGKDFVYSIISKSDIEIKTKTMCLQDVDFSIRDAYIDNLGNTEIKIVNNGIQIEDFLILLKTNGETKVYKDFNKPLEEFGSETYILENIIGDEITVRARIKVEDEIRTCEKEIKASIL